MSLFHISDSLTREDADSSAEAAVLVASGELDYVAGPQLRERILSQITAGRRHLVLDLSAVTFIDSTAIGTLVGAVTSLREVGGGSVRVVCIEENERVLRIFEISGVASVIALHRSLGEALAAVHIATRANYAGASIEQATVSALTRALTPAARGRGLEVARRYAEEATTALEVRSNLVTCRAVDELA